eukprot:TRINITY_DN1978_c0_g1_i3.p1 TRINITY_DN1978_c0_g1~~TRINITY_DN1978_c0_g1_i3.p1  ORF type:complete len:100 (+),score=2.97 TRINITY_DN1978_c0_g1_i3:453-752(+)
MVKMTELCKRLRSGEDFLSRKSLEKVLSGGRCTEVLDDFQAHDTYLFDLPPSVSSNRFERLLHSTLIGSPRSLWPCSFSLASSASASLSNSTNAKLLLG